jgi:hypothetical protein
MRFELHCSPLEVPRCRNASPRRVATTRCCVALGAHRQPGSHPGRTAWRPLCGARVLTAQLTVGANGEMTCAPWARLGCGTPARGAQIATACDDIAALRARQAQSFLKPRRAAGSSRRVSFGGGNSVQAGIPGTHEIDLPHYVVYQARSVFQLSPRSVPELAR